MSEPESREPEPRASDSGDDGRAKISAIVPNRMKFSAWSIRSPSLIRSE